MKSILIFLIYIGLSCESFSQVNIQTGSATYDIPIFNYSDKKGVSTSVSISYSSGTGFKPDDLAGNVGTGWNLLAGGFIQRVQNGEPDDQDSRIAYPIANCDDAASYSNKNCYDWAVNTNNYYGTEYITNYYPNGFMYSEYNNVEGTDISSSCLPQELKLNPRFLTNSFSRRPWKMSRRALADRQQDRFLFNINGRMGEFLIGKPTGGTKKILLPNGAKLKIDYDDSQDLSSMGIRTRIQSFTITDESGIVYKFNTFAKTHVMEYGTDGGGSGSTPQTYTITVCPPSTNSNNQNYVPCYGSCQPSNCPTVYKTTPLSNSRLNPFVINKWYLTEIYNPLTKASIYFQYNNKFQDNILSKSVSGTYYVGGSLYNTNYTEEREVIENKVLNKILLPDGTDVNFQYASIPRVDYKGNEPVTKIEIKYNGQTVSNYELNYRYFFKKTIVPYSTGPSYTGSDVKYLRLMLESVQKKAANTSEPPYTFQYYNGTEGGYVSDEIGVPPLHTVCVNLWGYYIGADFTTQDYPYIDFAFHVNWPTYGKAPQIGLIKKINIPYGGVIDYTYELSVAKDISGTQRESGGVKVNQITISSGDPNGQPVTTSYKYILDDGSSSGWGYEGTNVAETKSTISYYDARNEYGVSYKPSSQISVSDVKLLIKIFSKEILPLISPSLAYFFSNILGPASNVLDLINTAYSYIFNSDIGTDIAIWLGWISSSTETKYYTQYSYFPLTQRNPIGIHYSRVEVKNETLNNGKVVYEFSRPSQSMSEILPFTNNPKPRYVFAKFNNPKSVKYIDAFGNTIKETQSEYDTPSSDYNDASFMSCLTDVEQSYSEPYVNNNYLSSGNSIVHYYYYYPKLSNSNLKKQINIDYINNIAVNTEEISYTYDPVTLLLRETTTTNAKGEQVGNKKYYATDFPNSTVLQKLVNTYNVYNSEVSDATWIKKTPTASTLLVGVAHTEFIELPNGDIKPEKQYKSELLEPVTSTLTTNPVNPAAPTAEPFVKLQSTIGYNSDGDVADIVSPTGKTNSMLYDYSGNYVVAKISNSIAANCAYSSFEGNNHNNFSITNVGIVADKGITGTKCYDAFYSISYTAPLPIPTNPERKILSFWWYGHAPTISLSSGSPTLKEQTAPIQGWVFYLYEVPANVTSFTINSAAANTSYVDEVRFYPITARMATTTYNLPYGKSSVCSASNRLAFFEYDELGRITKELDENRNVVKTYEYKFKTP